MKKIPLTRGQFALVDDEDYEWLMQWKWCVLKSKHTCYAMRQQRISGKPTFIFMHRQILGLKPGDRRDVDHINHNGLDNRRDNIRDVSHQENTFNSNPRGYCWNRHIGKFAAQIVLNGRQHFLGYFDDRNNARAAYLAAKAELHKIGGVSCVA